MRLQARSFGSCARAVSSDQASIVSTRLAESAELLRRDSSRLVSVSPKCDEGLNRVRLVAQLCHRLLLALEDLQELAELNLPCRDGALSRVRRPRARPGSDTALQTNGPCLSCPRLLG